MKLKILLGLFHCSIFVHGFPSGHLNAISKESGASLIDVEKDVILTPGKDGDHFNAKSESNGHSLVTIGGGVFGSALNRSGEEFNAISKGNGSSQVRVQGDVTLEDLKSDANKFDAVSESGGQSIVQVGNVQIISTSRNGKRYNDVRIAVPIKKKTVDVKNGRDTLGPSWGAVAVAEHNSRPWEDLDNHPGDNLGVSASESDLFENNKPNNGLEIHDYPHDNSGQTTETTGISILQPVSNNSGGSLNAHSKGSGSKSIVQVNGSVQA